MGRRRPRPDDEEDFLEPLTNYMPPKRKKRVRRAPPGNAVPARDNVPPPAQVPPRRKRPVKRAAQPGGAPPPGGALEKLPAQPPARTRRPSQRRTIREKVPDLGDLENMPVPKPRRPRRRKAPPPPPEDDLRPQEIDYEEMEEYQRNDYRSPGVRRRSPRRTRDLEYDDYEDSPRRGSYRGGGMTFETKLMIVLGGGLLLAGLVAGGYLLNKTSKIRAQKEAQRAAEEEKQAKVDAGEEIARTVNLVTFMNKVTGESLDIEPDGVFFINADENMKGPAAYTAALQKAQDLVQREVVAPLKEKYASSPKVVACILERDVMYQKGSKKPCIFGDKEYAKQFTSVCRLGTKTVDVNGLDVTCLVLKKSPADEKIFYKLIATTVRKDASDPKLNGYQTTLSVFLEP